MNETLPSIVGGSPQS